MSDKSLIEYKKELLKGLLARAEEQEVAVKKALATAQNDANEAEGAMVSRYSTFKEEAQYLAGGLKGRLNAIQADIAMIKQLLELTIRRNNRVESLAIVTVEIGREEKKYFILPALAGEIMNDMAIITPSSPIGKALIRKETGDEFSFTVDGKKKTGDIIDVQ